ncbi:MAG: tetratricopeptide repeat protein [Oscillatoriaceae bacterium SKW80]|nr:tetratricopeptide repeat protein [Oscillatoriaceae bacterium SKYG93]MCX8122234.1 tetratricopeptide repeat protein [Oscillatoriaceae bacterium SKW80]MDW8454520.1 tetratricopeptide repeat protein [Oscillatoriaceae cyanobacterium SKYGB_i_bin93]HIK29382.1 tetratricopeptide repeat protein [Oscillatoriaceae cyanobacterium M7585_C2015_266]
MKIYKQVALAISTLLLSVEVACAVTQPKPSAARAATTAAPKPTIQNTSPVFPAYFLSEQERRELDQRRQQDRIRDQVQKEVARSFGFTTGLLNTLLFLLILFPVVGIISFWLMRRALASQIKTEVQNELRPELKAEIIKIVSAQLQSKGELPSSSHQLASSLNSENVAYLKELISMAMATQNVISEARATIENSLKAQTKTGELLKEVFESNQTQEAFESPQTQEAFEPSQTQEVFEIHNKQPDEKQGKDFFLEGRYEEALKVYEQAIEADPESYEAWCGKGIALTKMKRFTEAIQAFNQSIRLNSEYAESWYEKARCYALQKNEDSAIENLRRAINLNPAKKLAAKNDPDFSSLRDNEWFEMLVSAKGELSSR